MVDDVDKAFHAATPPRQLLCIMIQNAASVVLPCCFVQVLKKKKKREIRERGSCFFAENWP